MAKPKLALIPATQGSKLYSVLPADGVGDFTFSRGSAATRINKDGLIETVASGVSRLNYPLIDGVVNGCPSHLLEPQRTNLVTYSENIESWLTQNAATVFVNNEISPDGSLNADEINSSVLNSAKYQSITTVNSTNYTFSLFIKNKNSQRCRIEIYNSPNAVLEINFTNNIPTTFSNSVFTNIKYEEHSNEWFKVTGSFTATGTSNGFYIYPDRVNGSNSIYVWGVQVEQGSYPTSYIPTSGSSVTRSAETANGAGDASTFSDSQGVLMAEISALADLDNTRYITLNEGTSSVNILSIQYRNSGELRLYNGGTSTAQMIYRDTSLDLSEKIKIAIKYGTTSSSYKVYINGFSKTIESAFVATTMSGLDNLKFTDANGSGSPFYGNTKQIQYFDSALNDSDLETLTSWTSFTDMANGQLYSIK